MKISEKLRNALITAALFLFGAIPAFAEDYGQSLFNIILREFHPEKAAMTLSSLPRENGLIPWAYFELCGANVQGLRISKLKVDGFDAMVSPPERWKDLDYPEISSVLACHAEAHVTESDVNDFLMERAFGDKDEWSGVKVRMRDGRITASAYYLADLKLFRLKVKLEVSCVLAARHGTELWLEDIQLKVNNAEVSPSYVTRALEGLQPVINLSRYNLPLHISRIEFKNGSCYVRSRILPKPFDGIRWEYERKRS